MNFTHLAAALLPSYIMFVALLIADVICLVRRVNSPAEPEVPADYYAWAERNERPDVHAVMRALRLKDD